MTYICENCNYYRFLKEDEYAGRIGTCRYNPPIAVPAIFSDFPRVKAGSWCGKHKELV